MDHTAKQRLLQDLVATVAGQTGQNGETIQGDFERGRYFDAHTARAYGLIDAVIE